MEAYFLEPDISSPDDLCKLLSVCNNAGGLTPNKAKQIVYEACGETAEDYPGEWGNVPLAYSKVQNSSGGTDFGQLTRSLEKQIAKAAVNHDDEVVAVMKEVRALLQKGFTKDSEHGIIALGDWDESKHPRDENGRFTASGEPSPDGVNTFAVKGFRNAQKLNNHWENGRTHKEEYRKDGILTKKAYEERAVELLESPVGGDIRGHIDGQGNVIRYDAKTNDFAKGNPEKGVTTMFKPDDREKYYDEMRKKDLENGGKA